MVRQFLSLMLLASVFLISSALADDDKRKGAFLNVSASESIEIEEDLLAVNLRYEVEGKSPQEVQKQINEKMEKVLAEVKKEKEINVSTEQYSVYKYSPPVKKGEKKIITWKGNQSLQLKGIDSKTILKTTGKLQSMGLAVNSLGYFVSPELREKTHDSLMEKAVEKLLNKAKRVAKILGKDDIEVQNINVDSNNFYPAPMRASGVMMKNTNAESIPVAVPSQSRISTTVNAIILIKD